MQPLMSNDKTEKEGQDGETNDNVRHFRIDGKRKLGKSAQL